MPRRIAPWLLFVGGLIVAACSSGNADAPRGNEASNMSWQDLYAGLDQPLYEFIGIADATASGTPFILGNLPAGWAEEPLGPEDVRPEFLGDCAVLADDEMPGALFTYTSPDFLGPSNQELETSAAAYASEPNAIMMFDAYIKTISACEDELVAGYEAVLRDSLVSWGVDSSSVDELHVSFERLSSPNVGDSSSAYRVGVSFSVGGSSSRWAGDVYLIRIGQMVGSMTYTAALPNPAEEQTLLSSYYGKLVAGDDALLRGSAIADY